MASARTQHVYTHTHTNKYVRFCNHPFSPADPAIYLCKQCRSWWAVSSGSTLFVIWFWFLTGIPTWNNVHVQSQWSTNNICKTTDTRRRNESIFTYLLQWKRERDRFIKKNPGFRTRNLSRCRRTLSRLSYWGCFGAGRKLIIYC